LNLNCLGIKSALEVEITEIKREVKLFFTDFSHEPLEAIILCFDHPNAGILRLLEALERHFGLLLNQVVFGRLVRAGTASR